VDRVGCIRARDLFDAFVLILPLAVFSSVFLWLSENPIDPNSAVEASLTNPIGLLTSNFVYDGFINVENLVTSSVFLLIVCLYYPRGLRNLIVYLLPLVAVGAGSLAELTAISSPYTDLQICGRSCSFYGMSGVASAAIGFTSACFLVSFVVIAMRRKRSSVITAESSPSRLGDSRGQTLLLVCSFVVYVALLLLFSGLLTFPVSSISHQGGGGTPATPAILVETPPVAFVHSASIVYGFLLFLSIFIRTNRRFRLSFSQS
jgi:hypothetical protein